MLDPAVGHPSDISAAHHLTRAGSAGSERSYAGDQELAPAGHDFHATMESMPDYRAIEQQIQEMLGSPRRPVAVAYLDAPPAGVQKFSGSEPSSCSFWRLAAGGRAFYTVPADHLNCPVGGYTHNTL